jgi:hypothetical protein
VDQKRGADQFEISSSSKWIRSQGSGQHRLVIWIDRNDLVDDYEEEKTKRPSKRVY